MKYAYVCFKYSSDPVANTEAAIGIARRINAIPGWMAIVPHNMSRGLEDTKTYDEWMQLCLHIMRPCDVVVIDGENSRSTGCMIERNDPQHPPVYGIKAFERTFGNR